MRTSQEEDEKEFLKYLQLNPWNTLRTSNPELTPEKVKKNTALKRQWLRKFNKYKNEEEPGFFDFLQRNPWDTPGSSCSLTPTIVKLDPIARATWLQVYRRKTESIGESRIGQIQRRARGGGGFNNVTRNTKNNNNDLMFLLGVVLAAGVMAVTIGLQS